MNTLGIQKILENDCYLGLPMLVGKTKPEFSAINDMIGSRVQAWKGKRLSQAGKAILIQSIAHAIPLYVIRCFKLPKTFFHKLNMILACFW